jgi:hypothetical protein
MISSRPFTPSPAAKLEVPAGESAISAELAEAADLTQSRDKSR